MDSVSPNSGKRTTLDLALNYSRRGFCPIPIPQGEKGPRRKGWKELRYSEAELPQVFGGSALNIGLLLGEPSAWLVDVDLDSLQAVQLAREVLPATTWPNGRQSNPESYWWYFSPEAQTRKFEDPAGKMLVELRSTGCQTVVPPSVHLEGEQYTWYEFGSPATVEADALNRAVGLLA